MEPKRSESIHQTRVLDNPSQISEQIRHIAETYSDLSIASTFGGLQLIHNTFLDSYKKILGKYKKGEGNGIRWITNIEEECIELVKTFLDLNMQIKHVKNLPPINFAVGKNEVNLTIEKMEGGKMMQSLITSNEPTYVAYFYSIFEQLWDEGVDAQDRIRNITEGRAEETDIEIIPNPKKELIMLGRF